MAGVADRSPDRVPADAQLQPDRGEEDHELTQGRFCGAGLKAADPRRRDTDRATDPVLRQRAVEAGVPEFAGPPPAGDPCTGGRSSDWSAPYTPAVIPTGGRYPGPQPGRGWAGG